MSKSSENPDAVIFGSYQEDNQVHSAITFFQHKVPTKVEPTDIGYKFNILLFRTTNPEETDTDLFTAVIGDPRGYVERVCKAGYCGLLVKTSAFSKKNEKNKSMKDVFRKNLKIYSFSDSLVDKSLKVLLS